MLKGKVLIVEDQSNFRKGIIRMIESDGLGWDVVGEASNGQEALELLDQVKPDLVLTDIRMPIMDGLEFVGHLRQCYPGMLVIILTGYKNFEYAQAAVRYGAIDFLIKPCTAQDVRQVLTKASECFYDRCVQQQVKLVQHKLELDQELRALFLDLPISNTVIPSLNVMLNGKELWLLKMNLGDFVKPDSQKGDRSLLQFALSNIVEEIMMQARLESRLLLVEHDRIVLITKQGGINDSLKEDIQQAMLLYLKIRLKMMFMGSVSSAEQLTELYAIVNEDDLNTDDKFKFPEEQEVIPGITFSLNQARVNELEFQLMSGILIGQPDHVRILLEQLLKDLAKKSLDEMKVQALALSIALLKLVQKQFDPDGLSGLTRMPDNIPRGEWGSDEVLRWAGQQVKSFMQDFSKWQAAKSENVIEKATQYIGLHYHDTCRLTDVAVHIHLNPSYFSALFKKVKGESFTSYVTRVRIEKAALLLRNTEMRIFEIAAAVGFDEPNYFTNVFKLRYAMSPKEYRHRDMYMST